MEELRFTIVAVSDAIVQFLRHSVVIGASAEACKIEESLQKWYDILP